MAILVLRCQKLGLCMHRRDPGMYVYELSTGAVPRYLENPGRSRPKNERYRCVSTSATICARN
jgi:hypothetical protein